MKELPKRKKIRLSGRAYLKGDAFSITIATSERYPWFQLYPELSDKVIQLLIEMGTERKAILNSWCIMPDHAHILLQDKDIIDFVRTFKGRLTPIARRLEPGRSLWHRSFYDHALRKEESLNVVSRYIWGNPVRAGIVDRASNYPWSGSLVWDNWKEFSD